MHKVHLGRPVPAKNRHRATKPPVPETVYPFKTMPIGSAFFVPQAVRASVETQACTRGKLLGKMFVTRQAIVKEVELGQWVECDADDPAAEAGAGCWRTK